MTPPLIRGPTSWPAVGYMGILVSGSRDSWPWHRPPSEMGPTQTTRKSASETKQRSQKISSQYYTQKTPETRKWRHLALQTGSLRVTPVGVPGTPVRLFCTLWLPEFCPCTTTRFLSRWSLVLVDDKCLVCQLDLEKLFGFHIFSPMLVNYYRDSLVCFLSASGAI